MKQPLNEKTPLLPSKEDADTEMVVIDVRPAPVLCDDMLIQIGHYMQSSDDLLRYRNVNGTLFYALRPQWLKLKIREKAAEQEKEIDWKKLQFPEGVLSQYVNTLFATKRFSDLSDEEQWEFTQKGRHYFRDDDEAEIAYNSVLSRNKMSCRLRMSNLPLWGMFFMFLELASIVTLLLVDRLNSVFKGCDNSCQSQVAFWSTLMLLLAAPVTGVLYGLLKCMPVASCWACCTTAHLDYAQVRSGESIYEEELCQQQMELLDRLALEPDALA